MSKPKFSEKRVIKPGSPNRTILCLATTFSLKGQVEEAAEKAGQSRDEWMTEAIVRRLIAELEDGNDGAE